MGYALTEAIKNNASRGKGLAQKFKTDITSVLKSQDTLELEDVKKLYQFLTKAEKQYEPKKRLEGGALTKGTLEFLANGGTSGLAFCRNVLRQEGILKSYQKEISEEEMNREDKVQLLDLNVCKATNDELQQATFVVMVPDEVDLHGDITTEEEVRKAKESYNKFSMKCNLFHLTETDTFSIIESYISPVDFVLGERFVKKGTWLCTIQCNDDGLWALIKSGKICSVSIGAMAKVEYLEEDNDE